MCIYSDVIIVIYKHEIIITLKIAHLFFDNIFYQTMKSLLRFIRLEVGCCLPLLKRLTSSKI